MVLVVVLVVVEAWVLPLWAPTSAATSAGSPRCVGIFVCVFVFWGGGC